MDPLQLQGKPQRVLAAAGLTSIPVVLATVTYAYAVVDVPDGGWTRVAVLAGFAGSVIAAAVNARYSAALATFSALSRTSLPMNRQNLRLAARELSSLPDIVFVTSLAAWGVGSLAVGVGIDLLVPGTTVGIATRLACSGLLFAPLGAVLSQVVVTLRTREALAALPRAGMTIPELLEAVPSTRRQTGQRLMLLAAVLVLSPSAIAAHLTYTTFARAGQVGAGLEGLRSNARWCCSS